MPLKQEHRVLPKPQVQNGFRKAALLLALCSQRQEHCPRAVSKASSFTMFSVTSSPWVRVPAGAPPVFLLVREAQSHNVRNTVGVTIHMRQVRTQHRGDRGLSQDQGAG